MLICYMWIVNEVRFTVSVGRDNFLPKFRKYIRKQNDQYASMHIVQAKVILGKILQMFLGVQHTMNSTRL